MTSVETAKKLIETKGICSGISCCEDNCPLQGDPCEKSMEDAEKASQDTVVRCEAYLLEHAAEEASTLPLYSDTQQNMGYVLDSMKDLLIYKNNKYGNSALEPMDVFTRHVCNQNTAGLNSILVRLDDKLKRIQNADELRKNDVSDLIGYLTLLCVDQEWTDFSEFKD